MGRIVEHFELLAHLYPAPELRMEKNVQQVGKTSQLITMPCMGMESRLENNKKVFPDSCKPG